MNTVIRKADVPVVDMFDAEQEDRAIGKAISGEVRGRAVIGMNQYVQAVAMNRRLKAGDTQSELVARHSIPQGNISKLLTVARVADVHVNGDKALEGLANVDRDKLEEQRQNLLKFWGFATEGVESAPSVTDVLGGLVGDDGEARANALPHLYDMVGAPSSLYSIVTGTKFHENDPRSEQDTEGDDTDDDTEGDGGEPTPWQDRLTALIGQAKVEGATASDILAVVNAALK